MAPRTPPRTAAVAAKRRIASGMTLALAGVGWSAGTHSTAAAYLTLLGTGWALLGLHQLGRSGPSRRSS